MQDRKAEERRALLHTHGHSFPRTFLRNNHRHPWNALHKLKNASQGAIQGVRSVALNRLPIPKSSEFTPEELNIIMNGGTNEHLNAQLQACGHEIATFIDNVI